VGTKRKPGDVVKFPVRRTRETPGRAPLRPQASAREEGDGPIATKLVAAITKQVHGKVVNLGDVIEGRAAAGHGEHLRETDHSVHHVDLAIRIRSERSTTIFRSHNGTRSRCSGGPA
jgi:hypothetical protein